MGQSGPSPASTLAWRQHPAATWPTINESFMARCWTKDDAGIWSNMDPGLLGMAGDIFADGSYQKGLHEGLGRAAWACGQATADGELVRVAMGPRPKHIRQAPVTAEWMAVAVSQHGGCLAPVCWQSICPPPRLLLGSPETACWGPS